RTGRKRGLRGDRWTDRVEARLARGDAGGGVRRGRHGRWVDDQPRRAGAGPGSGAGGAGHHARELGGRLPDRPARPSSVISAIICAFWHQPHLHASVAALSASQGVAVEVIVVDNGSPDCAGLPPEVLVVSPGENLGFAGGCNRGAAHASGDVVVF